MLLTRNDVKRLLSQNIYRVIIPERYMIIEREAFKDCQCVEEIILHDKIEEIYEGAFSNCVNLRKIVLPKKVKIIKNNMKK